METVCIGEFALVPELLHRKFGQNGINTHTLECEKKREKKEEKSIAKAATHLKLAVPVCVWIFLGTHTRQLRQ